MAHAQGGQTAVQMQGIALGVAVRFLQFKHADFPVWEKAFRANAAALRLVRAVVYVSKSSSSATPYPDFAGHGHDVPAFQSDIILVDGARFRDFLRACA